MSIEKSNFNFGSNVKKSSMSDRNYLLRNQGRSAGWTHDSVKKLIEAKIQEEKVKQKMLNFIFPLKLSVSIEKLWFFHSKF